MTRDNFAVRNSPLVGNDAPTPARGQGLQPYGALTLFFRWRKKSVQKKASGTATLAARPAARRGLRSAVAPSGLSSTSVRFAHPSGKKASNAHFGGGARYVARSGVGQLTHAIVRARSSPFSAVKMGGPFSLRCLSPLCSPAVGVGQAYPLRGGMLRCGLAVLQRQVMRVSVPAQSAVGRLTHCRAGWFIMLDCFAAQSNEGFCSLAVGVGHTQPLQGFCFRRSGWRSVLPLAGDFGMPSTSGFGSASHEARRRMAV